MKALLKPLIRGTLLQLSRYRYSSISIVRNLINTSRSGVLVIVDFSCRSPILLSAKSPTCRPRTTCCDGRNAPPTSTPEFGWSTSPTPGAMASLSVPSSTETVPIYSTGDKLDRCTSGRGWRTPSWWPKGSLESPDCSTQKVRNYNTVITVIYVGIEIPKT